MTTTDISLALLLGPQLRAFTEAGYDVIGVSAPGPFAKEIEATGAKHLPLRHATRSVSLSSDFRALGELYSLFRRVRPDIVHTHNPKPGIYGRLAAELAGVPVVVNTVHGLYATPDDSFARRAVVYGLERLAATCSDGELVQNPEDLETLSRLGIPLGRLHLLGNGVDIGRFTMDHDFERRRWTVRAALGADDDTVVVLSVGRLVREKGYLELFDAAAAVTESHPEAMFVVAGPDEPSKPDALTPEEIRSGHRAGVRFLGHTSDVESLYAAADIYVLASHREGFPRSAMEAAAMGRPIVATNIRGCRQVVEHGATGLLVKSRDASSLAEAINSLVVNQANREAMGQKARAKAEREFDDRRIVALTLDLYRRLLADTDSKSKSVSRKFPVIRRLVRGRGRGS